MKEIETPDALASTSKKEKTHLAPPLYEAESPCYLKGSPHHSQHTFRITQRRRPDKTGEENMFKGAFTALVTPFKNGKVDEETFRQLVERQIEQGIHGLVPCGTTGESATMSHDEHKAVIKICVEQAKGRVPIIAGAGSNNTAEAISLTKFAKEAGADAVLHITPYYNKPTQEGLYQHFKAIAKAVPMPIVMYNVPGRTGCSMAAATVARIARDVPEVVGIKEATANMTLASNILEQCGQDFDVLSGDDFTVLPAMSLGVKGVISVVSNVLPGKMAALCNAFFAGDLAEARRLHYELEPLNRAMFLESNPIPVKAAMAMLGLLGPEIRLPLVHLQPANEETLRGVLKKMGLLK